MLGARAEVEAKVEVTVAVTAEVGGEGAGAAWWQLVRQLPWRLQQWRRERKGRERAVGMESVA